MQDLVDRILATLSDERGEKLHFLLDEAVVDILDASCLLVVFVFHHSILLI